jgi:hypothetical protein
MGPYLKVKKFLFFFFVIAEYSRDRVNQFLSETALIQFKVNIRFDTIVSPGIEPGFIVFPSHKNNA